MKPINNSILQKIIDEYNKKLNTYTKDEIDNLFVTKAEFEAVDEILETLVGDV